MSGCRLVQIEVKDFKSFGGTHIIGPFNNFTGIVGPNGSGKSNVLDSLAFVFFLDKEPRSTDYIHSVIGEEAVDSCSVKVTVEEEEGKKKKKKVTHTYERSVDSDQTGTLYIDGKEVEEEEYKTKILSKGFHPLLFVKQAEVDTVARKTPMELTQLFEEMSGSKEYAKKYDELRIQSEAAHEAVSMIEKRRRAAISEKKHISDRKNEAAIFRDKEKKEETLLIESSLYQLYYMKQQLEDSENRFNVNQQEQIQLKSNFDEAVQDLQQLESDKMNSTNKCIEIEEQLKAAEQQMRDSNARKIRAEEKKSVLSERLDGTIDKINMTKDEITRLNNSLIESKQEQEEITAQLEQLPVVDDIEKEISEYNSIREQASKQFDNITQALRKAMKDKNEEQHHLSDLKSQQDTLEATKSRLQENLTTTKSDLKKAQERHAEVRKKIGECHGNQRMAETRNQKDISEQNQKMKELRELEKQLEEIRRIEGTDRRRVRYQKAIETLQKIIPGVYGRFRDLCRPAKEKFRVAAEAGCSAYYDAIIVKDKEAAIRCINYLREQGAGTANFLPLQNLRPAKVSLKKNVLMLSQVMDCDPQYKPALNYVCSHIALVKTIDDARNLAFSEHITVVSEDGNIVDPRGIMTGGTTKNKSSTSSYQSSEQIEKKKKVLEQNLGQLGDAIESRKSDISKIEDELLHLAPQEAHQKKRISDLEDRKTQYEREIRIADQRIIEIKKQIESSEKVLRQKDEEVNKINLEQTDNDKIIFQKFCKDHGVDNIKDFEITRLQEFEERYAQRLNLQSKLSQLRARILFYEERTASTISPEELERQKEDFQDQLNSLEQEIKEATKESNDLEKKLAKIKKQRNNTLADDQSNRQEIKVKRKAVQEISDKLETIKDLLSSAEHDIQTAKQVLYSVLQQCRLANVTLPKKKNKKGKRSASQSQDQDDVQGTPSSLTQENLDKAEIDKIDFSSLEPNQRVKVSYDEFKKQVKHYESELDQIRAQIQQIKPDLKSDNRYTEVEKELDRINNDQEKLRQDATQIKKDFIEVKAKRRDLFMQLYDSVDQNIDRIYKKLTRVRNQENRSGTAYLALEDTEEPYLGGIKYTAMPPHKRFRDLDQLSGGEKAVASLALVVALQKNTESPFILMDEPDASLDKLNLRAAASALSEISKGTQIISVSLRDKFFEHSDVLVGIYKDKVNQSSGVITLNLSEFIEQNLEMEALE